MANSEYDKVFTKSDATGGSRNLMLAEDANIGITLNTLVSSGVVVGQTEMFSQDTIYYLNPEKKYHPEYKHPKMLRLERPTILHSGETRTVGPQRPAGWGQVASQSTQGGGGHS